MWHYLFNTQTGIVDFIYAWLHLPHLPFTTWVHSWALPTVIAIDIWRKTPLVSFLLLPGLLAIPSEQGKPPLSRSLFSPYLVPSLMCAMYVL